MANLGSDNTPIKGLNFELPAGAQIDEDNGDFVVRDSSGTIVFRRDEANNEWNLEGTDLANIGSVNTEKLNSSIYNAKAYGAVGDGSTDDTDAIQAALDDAESDGGGIVFIPEGTYLVGKDGTKNADELRPGDNVTMMGAGRGATVLKLKDGAELDVIRNKQAVDHTTAPNTNITIRDLSVDGNKDNQPTDSNNFFTKYHYDSDYNEQFLCGIRLKNVTNSHVENLESHDATGYGLQYAAATESDAANCWFYRCGDDGCAVSDARSGKQLSQHVRIEECFAWENGESRTEVTVGSGFEVDDGPFDVTFTDCITWDNVGGFDVHVHGGQVIPERIEFIDCKSYRDGVREDKSGHAFQIGRYNSTGDIHKDITMDGCKAVETEQNRAFHIAAVDGCRVVGESINPEGSHLGIFDGNGKVSDVTATVKGRGNGGAPAVEVQGSSNNGLENITIERCELTGNIAGNGIEVTEAQGGVTLRDNEVVGFADSNIEIASNCEDIRAVGNTVKDNGNSATGVAVYGSTDCLVEGNDISKGHATPVDVDFGGTALVRDNDGAFLTATYASSATAAWADELILADGSSEAVTVTLPDPTTWPGRQVRVKAIDVTNSVSVAPNGTENIDEANSSITLASEHDSYLLRTDGSDWWVDGGVGA